MSSLNLWKRQLGEVPSSVWEQLDLEELILADNGLWLRDLEARGVLVYR